MGSAADAQDALPQTTEGAKERSSSDESGYRAGSTAQAAHAALVEGRLTLPRRASMRG